MDTSNSARARRTPLVVLLMATAVSEFGSVLAAIAIPWFVLQTTDSPANTGLAAGVTVLGFVVAGLFGGPVADRLGPKVTSVLADSISCLIVALIPLLHYSASLAFWQLLVLAFLRALLAAPGVAARRGLTPSLAAKAGTTLERANSAYLATGRVAQMLGPPLAGIVIATLGTGAALWLDAASFVLSAVAVAIAIPAPFRKRTIEASSGGYLAELAAGLQFIRREPLVRSIVLVYAATELLDAPLVAVALPVYAETIFNSPTQLGLMVGSLGAGSLAGSVLFGIFGHRLSRRLTFFTSLLVLQLPYWVLVAIPPLPIVAVALFIMGLAAGPLNALLYTIVQERTPTEMTGRVMGILAAGGMATVPLGMALCGYTLETIGLQPTLFGLAAIYIAVTLLFGLSTALRKMDEYEIGNDANSRHRSSVARQSERSLRS